jgi:hypothetical protein
MQYQRYEDEGTQQMGPYIDRLIVEMEERARDLLLGLVVDPVSPLYVLVLNHKLRSFNYGTHKCG